MRRAVFDTRFLAELYYSKDARTKQRLAKEKRCPEKFLSAVTVHEIYKLALSLEGRETAELKVALLKNDFEIIVVDEEIAKGSAGLRQKYRLSMGDSMIAATSIKLGASCITDDPHFKQIKEIKTTWL